MPTIESQVSIAAPIAAVYAIAKDAEQFPTFMPDVKELEVVEREGSRVVSRWIGLIPQFKVTVKWTQEDNWDDAEHLVNFRQLRGDFDEMHGTWSFEETAQGTEFRSVLNYEYHVPVLGPLVKKVVHHLMTANVNSALQAIKRKAEGGEPRP